VLLLVASTIIYDISIIKAKHQTIMKKFLLLILLPFLFNTFSSFTYYQDNDVPYVIQEDSTSYMYEEESKVNVQFEPAQIIIDDIRTTEYLSQMGLITELHSIATNKLVSALDDLNSNLFTYLQFQQEGRWETIIDRLGRATNYTEEDILSLINLKAKVDAIYTIWLITIVSLFLLFSIFIFYRNDYKHGYFDWKYILRKMGIVAFILGSMLFIGKQFLYHINIVKIDDMTMYDYNTIVEHIRLMLSG